MGVGVHYFQTNPCLHPESQPAQRRIIPGATKGVLPLRTVTALSLRHAHLLAEPQVENNDSHGKKVTRFPLGSVRLTRSYQ